MSREPAFAFRDGKLYIRGINDPLTPAIWVLTGSAFVLGLLLGAVIF